MKIFPANSREWRSLILLPGQAYVLAAPGCFLIWDLMTAHHFRGAWEEAAATVAMGYLICFLVLGFVGIIFCMARDIETAVVSFVFALLAFVFMGMISLSVPAAAMVSLFIVACRFAPAPEQMTPLTSREAFACPNCLALILSHEQRCSKCGWTYLE
jgi:hypothetical protein